MLLAESLLGTSSASAPVYVEDVFSTYLYTGNNSNRSITNDIDLSTKGGLVWIKKRNGATNFRLIDTARGNTKILATSTVSGQSTGSNELTAFLTNGFSLGTDDNVNGTSSNTYVSWSFRKQSKFFDVVTYTGNAVAGRTISHSLGSVPGCIIIKQLSGTQSWTIYHRSIGNTKYLQFDNTAEEISSTRWNDTTPTSTVFTVGSHGSVNSNGDTYVAYLFAHDAGGFGTSGADNVISCGSYTGNGTVNAGPVVTLGYEPQWLLIKSTGSAYWLLFDNMRGTTSGGSNVLIPPLDAAELVNDSVYGIQLLPTGFQPTPSSNNSNINVSGQSYIYIAIRRGPMKTPTSGTSVYAASTYGGNSTDNRTISTGIVADLAWIMNRTDGGNGTADFDRMRGKSLLRTADQAVDENSFNYASFATQSGIIFPSAGTYTNGNGYNYVAQTFRRAPGFLDVVCYTGTGVARTISHNLGVAPEMYIVKSRTTALASNDWWVNCAYLPTPSADSVILNSNGANNTGNGALLWNSTLPTSSVFSIGTYNGVNTSGTKFVTYLFATVAGVSKVFSYTGNGSSQTINCGFTGGARFVLIKRIDSTGDWYVWDSARGIVAANDPHLSLNSTAAEVTTDDSVDTGSSGFIVNQVAATNINVNAATYIGLAIA